MQEALKCLKTVTPINNFYHLIVWLQTKQKLNKRSERGSGAHGEVSSAQWIRIGSVYVVTKTHHPCITYVKPEISKKKLCRAFSTLSKQSDTLWNLCIGCHWQNPVCNPVPLALALMLCPRSVMRSLLKCEYVVAISFVHFHGCILIDPFCTHLTTSNKDVIILAKSQQKIREAVIYVLAEFVR